MAFTANSLAEAEEPDSRKLKLVVIRLTADEQGDLAALLLDGEELKAPKEGKGTVFDTLQLRVRKLVEENMEGRKANDFEAEFRCDRKLKFVYVAQAMDALMVQKVDDKGESQRVALIDKITFVGVPPKKEAEPKD